MELTSDALNNSQTIELGPEQNVKWGNTGRGWVNLNLEWQTFE